MLWQLRAILSLHSFVHLDEVVAPSKGAQGAHHPLEWNPKIAAALRKPLRIQYNVVLNATELHPQVNSKGVEVLCAEGDPLSRCRLQKWLQLFH